MVREVCGRLARGSHTGVGRPEGAQRRTAGDNLGENKRRWGMAGGRKEMRGVKDLLRVALVMLGGAVEEGAKHRLGR